jgi:hypothetical protein
MREVETERFMADIVDELGAICTIQVSRVTSPGSSPVADV